MQHSFQKECIYGQGGEAENDPPISQMGTSFLVQLALIMPIISKKSYRKRPMECLKLFMHWLNFKRYSISTTHPQCNRCCKFKIHFSGNG